MQLYEKAMNEGSTTATHSLGIEYRNKQNFKKAFELYKKANPSSEFFQELSIGLSLEHAWIISIKHLY
ncbi:hypothetical protein [Chryseobacterium sp. ERMR1:04]|uniref:hypothetical protein n=1 Tax=Chryseobacterium sp. ERMR1:04 TaxID=1705393 RepID=UPI0006C8AF7C|nr:hypothetical protein [Chryseobacterium sp. ERMR1:04]KPH14809.1 hypothetical protein AMQ68_05070 [Chryseobacterium sp. ERMR1:04]